MEEKTGKGHLFPASILLSAMMIAAAWIYTVRREVFPAPYQAAISAKREQTKESVSEEKVLPPDGAILPIRWGDLGAKMASVGVIDAEKFERLYENRSGLGQEAKNLLYGAPGGAIKITKQNAGVLLNLFWALGLGTKNDILEKGEMTNPQYGGTQNFASTGGWTLAKGDAMNHYSRHPFVVLTPDQQRLAERVSKNIYRPCCNNPTHFPDCNHGMAMLGLLELMASQGVSEEEMYKVALQVNAYWFPDTYLTIAQYLAPRGVDWSNANPKEILGAEYSSASGYQNILLQITAPVEKNSGTCGV